MYSYFIYMLVCICMCMCVCVYNYVYVYMNMYVVQCTYAFVCIIQVYSGITYGRVLNGELYT